MIVDTPGEALVGTAALAAVLLVLILEAAILVLVTTSPLTLIASGSGMLPRRGGGLHLLGTRARILLALPAAGTLSGMAARAAWGNGSWSDLIVATMIHALLFGGGLLQRRAARPGRDRRQYRTGRPA